MRIESHGNRDFVFWSSMDEQIDAGIANLRAGVTSDIELSGRFLGRDFYTVDALEKAARDVWAPGVANVERMVAEIRKADIPPPRSIRREGIWTEDYGDFDYDRFADGEPWNRSTRRRRLEGHQFITICVQIGALGGYSAESLFWRGAAALAISDVLEGLGYSVEIVAYTHTSGTLYGRGNHQLSTVVPVKAMEAACDVKRIANLVSGWYFRTVVFASYYSIGRPVSGGKGSSNAGTMEACQQMTPDENVWNIVNVWDFDDAAELARAYFATLRASEESLV